ncbi:MAG: Rqc2 family fibronectin-binding protein [Erysipelotrichaceae bacterium]|jgi:predicted ribosome quality control (RQC) complex YloA/Tae2 family protein
MAFDGVFLHQVIRQLQPLVKKRINRIYQISDTEILFIIKGYQPYQLIISAHSSYNRIHLTNRNYPTRLSPGNFIILLRKYAEGGIIKSITQAGLDRYLIIEVDSRDDIGDKITVQIYVELMGKYANVILVKDGRIIDALKHIPPFENTIRTIQPGAPFTVTAPQKNKLNPFETDDVNIEDNLSKILVGFSPLLSQEVSYRLQRQSYRQIIKEIKESASLHLTVKNNEEYFHCIALTHLSDEHQCFEICEGLDYLYFKKEEKERIRHITGDLFKFTRKEISKLTKKIDNLLNSLQEALDCDRYRHYGDLIFANLDKIKKGMHSVTLHDFEGNLVTIPLDEKLDGKGNGKKHFTKYRKLSTGQKYINEQINIARENLEYFELIQKQLEYADFDTAAEIRQELESNGYLKTKIKNQRSKKPNEPNYTKLQYQNKTILIGKNNIQNEFITFKKSDRFDCWFHVKDGSGAHVIINTSEPDEDEIRFCAMLAAWFSKNRYSSSIPVNYTLVRNLKKIPNSKIGKLILKEYKTIYIDIDEEKINAHL